MSPVFSLQFFMSVELDYSPIILTKYISKNLIILITIEIISITLGCKFPENKKELITNIITKINNDKRKSEQKISLKEAYISEDDKFSIKYREIDI